MLRFLKKSLNEIATAFVPHVPISPILSSTVSAQHFFCGLSNFCNARTVCRLLHHDNFLSQHKKYGRLVLLFKVAVHNRRFKISFWHQIVKGYFTFHFPLQIPPCVHGFMAQDNLAERMKRIFDMFYELFRISHFLSSPFFPVGGYYNKKPCRIYPHRFLYNMSY